MLGFFVFLVFVALIFALISVVLFFPKTDPAKSKAKRVWLAVVAGVFAFGAAVAAWSGSDGSEPPGSGSAIVAA